MSSDDSDSDMCDFMTDAGSKLGKDIFWNKFKLKQDDEDENETCRKSSRNAPSPIEIHEPQVSNKDEKRPKQQKSPNAIHKVDEFADINVGNRLETLSKKVKEILASSKPARGGRGKGKGRGRAKRIALPYTKKVTGTPVKINNGLESPYSASISSHGPIRPKRRANCAANPKVTEIILSDDESTNNPTKPKEQLNPLVSVKVLWKSTNSYTFHVKKYQTFQAIKDYFVKEKNANPRLLYFTFNNKEIDLESCSVVTLQLKEGDVIEGSILSKNYLDEQSNVSSVVSDNGLIKLKVQFNAKRSNMFDVTCRQTDKMDIVFWQVIQETRQPIEKVKLYFDGELLTPNREIAALDLEEGDCFDLVVV